MAVEPSGQRQSSEAFIDTNVLLRYLLDDIPEQADAVESLLLQAAQGQLTLHTNALVLAEIIWTCESYYQLPKHDIKDMLLMILNTPGLEVSDRELITEAIFAYADENIDFVDAFNGCWMKQQGIETIYTFDQKHYKRIQGTRAKTPRSSRQQSKRVPISR